MDSVSVSLNSEVQSRVEVAEACGEWFVRVVDGNEDLTRAFELESYALAFAEGQRIRLKIDKFVRV